MNSLHTDRPLTPTIPSNEQLFLPLVVPDSSFRKTIHVVNDAGALIAALESGIPDEATLREGFLKIPRPDWTTQYTSSETRAVTTITASQNTAGTHPFTINLIRTSECMGPEGALTVPESSYRGSIHYTIGGLARHVLLHDQPRLIATLISTLEDRLLEPSARDTILARVEGESKRYAASLHWIMEALARPDAREGISPLPDTLCQSINQETDTVLRSWHGDGYSWEMESISRAFLLSFPTGDSLALARLNLLWCDSHGNQDPEQAVLIVASPHQPSSRFSKLLLNDSSSVPDRLRKAAWELTRAQVL